MRHLIRSGGTGVLNADKTKLLVQLSAPAVLILTDTVYHSIFLYFQNQSL